MYFENKQDLVNKVYLAVKAKFTDYAFETYTNSMTVEEGFEQKWKRIADFKLNHCEEAMFLVQCDTTPIIDTPSRQEGIKHLQPLLDVWQRGKNEGIIKPLSDYVLYAYTINPLSFLMIMQQEENIKIENSQVEEAFQAAWDSIKIIK